MAVSALQTSTGLGTAGGTGSRTDRGVGALKSEDFFKILITELRQQDPLQPAKTSDMISNVSQIRSIEMSGQLTQTLDTIAKQQRTAGTSEMIGKYVVAVTQGPDGTPLGAEGVVTSVQFASDGTAVLELDSGQTVRASDVAQITTVDEAQRRMTAAGQDQLMTPAPGADPAASTAKQRLTHKTAGALQKLFRL
jgi:flagellar basal-body rod modification protein FlgD